MGYGKSIEKDHMGSHPTLHMDETDSLHTANSVLSPAHIRAAVLSGDGCPLQCAAPVLLRHPLCGGKKEVSMVLSLE